MQFFEQGISAKVFVVFYKGWAGRILLGWQGKDLHSVPVWRRKAVTTCSALNKSKSPNLPEVCFVKKKVPRSCDIWLSELKLCFSSKIKLATRPTVTASHLVQLEFNGSWGLGQISKNKKEKSFSFLCLCSPVALCKSFRSKLGWHMRNTTCHLIKTCESFIR